MGQSRSHIPRRSDSGLWNMRAWCMATVRSSMHEAFQAGCGGAEGRIRSRRWLPPIAEVLSDTAIVGVGRRLGIIPERSREVSHVGAFGGGGGCEKAHTAVSLAYCRVTPTERVVPVPEQMLPVIVPFGQVIVGLRLTPTPAEYSRHAREFARASPYAV